MVIKGGGGTLLSRILFISVNILAIGLDKLSFLLYSIIMILTWHGVGLWISGPCRVFIDPHWFASLQSYPVRKGAVRG